MSRASYAVTTPKKEFRRESGPHRIERQVARHCAPPLVIDIYRPLSVQLYCSARYPQIEETWIFLGVIVRVLVSLNSDARHSEILLMILKTQCMDRTKPNSSKWMFM